eukprot:7361860-Prymnesium_polylepis.1
MTRLQQFASAQPVCTRGAHTQRTLRLALQRLGTVRGVAGGQRGTKGNARAALRQLRGRPPASIACSERSRSDEAC